MAIKSTALKKNSSKKTTLTTVKSSWKKDLIKVYDLEEIFEKLNQEFFNQKLKTKIIWARQGLEKARRYRRLGCYLPTKNLIKINPILNSIDVPHYFITYIVYHEMLHAVYPPILYGQRRYIHHKKFMEMEKAFPQYAVAKAWEDKEGKKKFF